MTKRHGLSPVTADVADDHEMGNRRFAWALDGQFLAGSVSDRSAWSAPIIPAIPKSLGNPSRL